MLTHPKQKTSVKGVVKVSTSQISVLLLVWIVFPEVIRNTKNKHIAPNVVLEDILEHPKQKAIVQSAIKVNTNQIQVLHLVCTVSQDNTNHNKDKELVQSVKLAELRRVVVTRKNVTLVLVAPIKQNKVQQPVRIAYRANIRQEKTKQIVLYVLLGELRRKKKEVPNVKLVRQVVTNRKKERSVV